MPTITHGAPTQQPFSTFDPYRACALCDHQCRSNDERMCKHENVVWHGKPISIAEARAFGGPCGKEAEYLQIKGKSLVW